MSKTRAERPKAEVRVLAGPRKMRQETEMIFQIACACGANVAAVFCAGILAGLWCGQCAHAYDEQGKALALAA